MDLAAADQVAAVAEAVTDRNIRIDRRSLLLIISWYCLLMLLSSIFYLVRNLPDDDQASMDAPAPPMSQALRERQMFFEQSKF